VIPVKSMGFFTRFGEYFDLERSPQSEEDAQIDGTSERLMYSSDGWRRPFLLWIHEVVGNNEEK